MTRAAARETLVDLGFADVAAMLDDGGSYHAARRVVELARDCDPDPSLDYARALAAIAAYADDTPTTPPPYHARPGEPAVFDGGSWTFPVSVVAVSEDGAVVTVRHEDTRDGARVKRWGCAHFGTLDPGVYDGDWPSSRVVPRACLAPRVPYQWRR